MKPELNLTYEEKTKISVWKQSLHDNNERHFVYSFVESGKLSPDNCKLYNYHIRTSDGEHLVVATDIELS